MPNLKGRTPNADYEMMTDEQILARKKERQTISAKKYYHKNKEICKARQALYRENNRDSLNEYFIKYRAEKKAKKLLAIV